MEAFAIGLFAVAVIGIPIAILLYNDYGSKRGCGRGCATCGTGISATGKEKQRHRTSRSCAFVYLYF